MLMNIEMLPSKTNCTNKLYIFKLMENSSFDHFTDWTEGTNIFKSTFKTMENQGSSLNNMEKMKFDEHRIVTIQNKFHQ